MTRRLVKTKEFVPTKDLPSHVNVLALIKEKPAKVSSNGQNIVVKILVRLEGPIRFAIVDVSSRSSLGDVLRRGSSFWSVVGYRP